MKTITKIMVIFRLEQLEDSSGSKRLAELSREEYVENINELKKKLLIAWENEKKIESVKVFLFIIYLI